jgi:hypothetical protein
MCGTQSKQRLFPSTALTDRFFITEECSLRGKKWGFKKNLLCFDLKGLNCGFYCADFNETQKCSAVLRGDLHRISPKSVKNVESKGINYFKP